MGKKNAIEEIVRETRESFDLGDFLRGRSTRTKTVRVFTDEVTAERRGGFAKTTETLSNGVQIPAIRSWGLVKELAEAQGEYDALESKTTKEAKALKAKVATITDEIKALTAELVETSLEVELKAVPKVIKKDAYRAAKKALGINGKISDTQVVEFIDEHSAQILHRTVVSIKKESSGEENAGVSVESARDLVGLLPDSEWAKIDAALKELLDEQVIADQVVEDRDF